MGSVGSFVGVSVVMQEADMPTIKDTRRERSFDFMCLNVSAGFQKSQNTIGILFDILGFNQKESRLELIFEAAS